MTVLRLVGCRLLGGPLVGQKFFQRSFSAGFGSAFRSIGRTSGFSFTIGLHLQEISRTIDLSIWILRLLSEIFSNNLEPVRREGHCAGFEEFDFTADLTFMAFHL